MLNKPKIQNSAEIRETFGDLKKKQFRIPKDCEAGKGPTVGNARCYAAVSFIFDFRFTFCLIDDFKSRIKIILKKYYAAIFFR